MKTVRLALAGAALGTAMLVSAAAQAGIVITVDPTLAPNAFGSPSWAQYESNTVNALIAGQTTSGDPASPSYFQITPNVTAAQGIVTSFTSWKGVSNPSGAFANEEGNRMTFAFSAVGTDGTQFSISELSFNGASSDPGDILGQGFNFTGYDYSSNYVGVIYNPDGSIAQEITSGPDDQLVDAIFGRGSGNSLEADCAGCTPAQEQAAINAAASYFTAPTTFTGTYTIGDFQGSGSFNISPIPEPATWALMLAGFGGLGAAMRRTRRGAVAATA